MKKTTPSLPKRKSENNYAEMFSNQEKLANSIDLSKAKQNPMKRKIKVILFTGKKNQTYFRVLGGNNKTVCQSEGYLSIKNAMKTIKLLQGANDWIIKDETTKK